MRITSPVMTRNDDIAAENRRAFGLNGVLAFNIISSPGAGKTTLLEALTAELGPEMAVIEGDVKTRRDADRIIRAGCRAVQIETGGSCHLDAAAVKEAFSSLDKKKPLKYLAIENVGNLICPSAYDLGEHIKIGMLSLPEGDDKVLKYPSLFCRIGVLLLTKTDLLPHMDFDMDRVESECISLNPGVKTFRISAKTGQGMEELCSFLRSRWESL
ncbi:MAG: hydrogenase nickel incorporation protein HypB [Candidatus Fermentibacteraceae bacterium]